MHFMNPILLTYLFIYLYLFGYFIFIHKLYHLFINFNL